MQSKKQGALHGALILLVSAALVKCIGAFFKIPLSRLIGGTGMGYYMSAYEIYAPIYTIAMAGLPAAISKIVSANVSKRRYNDVQSCLRAAKTAFLITGLAGFMLILTTAYPFASYIAKDSGILPSILVIAPSMLFCCITACYRGYYEGLRNMYPTAISQVIEAVGKLLFGYLGASVVLRIGMQSYTNTGKVFGIDMPTENAAFETLLPYAAAAAIGGVTLGTFISTIYMAIRHRFSHPFTKQQLQTAPKAFSDAKNMKTLCLFALPVVLGALAQNVSGLIDLITVQNSLNQAVLTSPQTVSAGFGGVLQDFDSNRLPTFLYGCYKGYAYSFYNLLPSVTSVIGVSVLPNLTAAWCENDRQAVKLNIESVLRVTSVLVMPVGFVLSVLSKPTLQLLFSGQTAEIEVSAKLLVWLSIAGILSAICVPLTSMLQAIDKQTVPVRNLLIGIAVKFVMNWMLVKNPSVNIMGAAYSTLACYAVVLLLDFICLCRYSGVFVNALSVLVKPAVSAAAAAIGAKLLYNWCLAGYFGFKIFTSFLISGIFSVILYMIVLFCLKTITKNDLILLPKGEKVIKVLEKLHLLG